MVERSHVGAEGFITHVTEPIGQQYPRAGIKDLPSNFSRGKYRAGRGRRAGVAEGFFEGSVESRALLFGDEDVDIDIGRRGSDGGGDLSAKRGEQGRVGEGMSEEPEGEFVGICVRREMEELESSSAILRVHLRLDQLRFQRLGVISCVSPFFRRYGEIAREGAKDSFSRRRHLSGKERGVLVEEHPAMFVEVEVIVDYRRLGLDEGVSVKRARCGVDQDLAAPFVK